MTSLDSCAALLFLKSPLANDQIIYDINCSHTQASGVQHSVALLWLTSRRGVAANVHVDWAAGSAHKSTDIFPITCFIKVMDQHSCFA